ncbi:MAG: hypothetical protein EHM35_05595 [Planctomycetaceae bacterium]|nr:MAG: hypothetical protein EHM35_05595 [Planctomycetaceae bacterium]
MSGVHGTRYENAGGLCVELSALDYGVFALYCVAVLAVGWWVARKEKTSQDYFLAGILLAPVIAFHIVTAYLRPAPPASVAERWIWKPHLFFLPAQERSASRP